MKILAALLVVTALSVGCTLALKPTVPNGSPPRVDPGWLIFEVPADVVEANSQRSVREHRDAVLERERTVRRARIEAILQRLVLTGMTAREVLWIFEAHPTRVRDQGPPGGHTYYWEPSRYWVRFDEMGLAVQGGRY